MGAVEVALNGGEREVLERWARRPKSSQALALRCRIVLAAAEGKPNTAIAHELGCNRATVGKWRDREAGRPIDTTGVFPDGSSFTGIEGLKQQLLRQPEQFVHTVAERLLAAVAAQLVIPPQVQVSMKAEPADAVKVLEEYAHEAAMLVLGRDNVSWIERLFFGAVTSQVVDQIRCPLVVVPGNWRPRYARPRLPVIVALDLETAPEPALKLAFEEARLRDARLIVLHAQPMSASDHEVHAAQFGLDVVQAEWQQNHPEVAVSTAIVSGDADTQLVRWSRWAAVLVVGHPHRRTWDDWTRSVARAVMRQTHGALMVAPDS